MRRALAPQVVESACRRVEAEPVCLSPTVALRGHRGRVEVWDLSVDRAQPVACFSNEAVLQALQFADQQAEFPDGIGRWLVPSGLGAAPAALGEVVYEPLDRFGKSPDRPPPPVGPQVNVSLSLGLTTRGRRGIRARLAFTLRLLGRTVRMAWHLDAT